MNIKRGFLGAGFFAIGFLIVVQVSIAQFTPPLPPYPPGFEEWLENNANSFSFPSPPGGGSGGGTNEPQYNPPPYDFEGLGLTVPVFLTNNLLHLTLFDNSTNSSFTNFPYHIYGRTKFNFHYRWRELEVGTAGQTNFYLPNPAPSNMFYIALLGTDADGDLLIDGLEALIGTDPNETDSDLDGLSDYLEWRIGSNPLNAAGIESDTNGVVKLRVHTRLK